MILSVVSPGACPWTYTPVRSIFTDEERIEQTVATVTSVRTYLPNAHVVIVECNDIPALRAIADTYVLMPIELRNICLTSSVKGYGEVLQTIVGIEALPCIPCRLFKLSGRYQLTPAFNSSLFSTETYTFSKRHSHGVETIPTVLYCVASAVFNDYVHTLKQCINVYQHYAPGLESLLPQLCSPKVLVEPIGVKGYVGVDGALYEA